MFRLALCGKNYELLEKIESHIQSFVETYKNETKCISIEQYKQLASLRDDMVDGIHFDILMVEIDAHPHEDFRLLSEILTLLNFHEVQSELSNNRTPPPFVSLRLTVTQRQLPSFSFQSFGSRKFDLSYPLGS